MALRDKLDLALRTAFTGIVTIVIISLQIPSNATYTPETTSVHQNLNSFQQRGLIFIETFPPLSYHLTVGKYILIRLN